MSEWGGRVMLRRKDLEKTLWDIHIELKGLNEEAAILAAQIQKNFEELGV
ncbi:hypothetical protein GO003_017800 [Methylicorpusculum oleiharenae]|nr:hypothetical protein [Methylicorpusculum oleiharenae]MCD2452246.1 hypothetical protein [Methylicorpusculum oleiharenae]